MFLYDPAGNADGEFNGLGQAWGECCWDSHTDRRGCTGAKTVGQSASNDGSQSKKAQALADRMFDDVINIWETQMSRTS